jgi:hypothetical protein
MSVERIGSVEAMEEALAELRDLEWRAPSGGGRLGYSPVATDVPTRLMQREVGDIAGEYSETLLRNEAGKELPVRKLDSPRPRTPLRARDVERLEQLRGWLDLLLVRDGGGHVVDALDKRIVYAASFHLWRGEPIDWVLIKRRLAYPHSRQRLARRYREALCRLVCLVNGVPVRHFRTLLARSGGAFADLLDR